jgi:hypothetical protein
VRDASDNPPLQSPEGGRPETRSQQRASRVNPFEVLLEAARARALERMAEGARLGAHRAARPPAAAIEEPPDWALALPDYPDDVHLADLGNADSLQHETMAAPGSTRISQATEGQPRNEHHKPAGGGQAPTKSRVDLALPSVMVVAGYYSLSASETSRAREELAAVQGAAFDALSAAYAYVAGDLEVLLNRRHAQRMVFDAIPLLRVAFAKARAADDDDEKGVSMSIMPAPHILLPGAD